MMVRIITHSTELTATRWTPTGGKVGHDIIPTDREREAIANGARMMAFHAVGGIGYSPVGYVLEMLRKAVR